MKNNEIKNYYFLNVYRFIMSILVVLNHTNPFIYLFDDNIYLYNFNHYACKLAVPFFFLTTGFFIGKKINNINTISNSEFCYIKKRMDKILKLYIIFTCIYLPLTIYDFSINKYSILKCTIYFLRGFLIVGQNFNSWILWFLLSEIFFLSFIYLFKNKLNDNNKYILIGIILLVIGIFIDLIIKYNFFGIPNIIKKIINFFIPEVRIFDSFIYIPLGILISKKEHIKIPNIIFMSIIFSLIILNVFIYNILIFKASIVISSILIFMKIIKINFKDKKVSDYCKFVSEDVYYWHLIIFSIIQYIVVGNIGKNYNIIYSMLTIIITLALSTLHYIYKNRKKAVK